MHAAIEYAGMSAGAVKLVLGEPTAAAVAVYMMLWAPPHNRHTSSILVCDIGGGTSDISLVRFDKSNLPGESKPTLTAASIAVSGDSRLGGTDITHAVVKRIMEKVAEQGIQVVAAHGSDPRNVAMLKCAEELKHNLGSSRKDQYYTHPHDCMDTTLIFTWEEYKALLQPFGDRCVMGFVWVREFSRICCTMHTSIVMQGCNCSRKSTSCHHIFLHSQERCSLELSMQNKHAGRSVCMRVLPLLFLCDTTPAPMLIAPCAGERLRVFVIKHMAHHQHQ